VVLKRYRLRFLLQEVDLVKGATIVGRSPECHVTIEDPLVSRQHARIVVDESGATCEDLGSRNGVKVNGRPIRGVAPIKDGDRLRIGTQELVFCELKEVSANQLSKTTGFLRHCARCRLPYPQELTSCPSCGATEQLDEDTMTGELNAMSEHSWTLQLLVEVLDKAVSLGRLADAARTLQRIAHQIDDRITAGHTLEQKQVEEVVAAAVRASIAAGDPTWTAWGLRLYARVGVVPTRELTEHLAELALAHRSTLRPPLAEAVDAGRKAPSVHTDDIARLEQLLAAVDLAEQASGADITGVNPALR
jgi:hypothetical protein